MTEMAAMPDTVERLCQETQEVIEAVTRKARDYDLSKPPRRLEEYQQQLIDNTCRVLVVGEAKRGKSTFINALIGGNILPTGLDVATAQAFLVQHAAEKAYRVRFVDNTCRQITEAELVHYGSERIVPSYSIVVPDRVISCIEVDTPSEFWPLPKGIHILDTPGLGGFSAAHAEITQRFIPGAGAAIFILDSRRPIAESEVKFIKSILTQTKNMLFIQTKIDKYGVADWKGVRQRSEEILRKHFKDTLPDLTIWPLSSINLIQARWNHDEDYLAVSHYKELRMALLAFLARASGGEVAWRALDVAREYVRRELPTLWRRQGRLDAASESALDTPYRHLQDRKAAFDAAWKDKGTTWQAAAAHIKKLAQQAEQQVDQALKPQGGIETAIRKKIAELRSTKAAKDYGQKIAQDISATIQEEWDQADQQMKQGYSSLVRSLLEAATVNDSMPHPNIPSIADPADHLDSALRAVYLYTSKEIFSTLNEVIVEAAKMPADEKTAVPTIAFLVFAASLWAAIRLGFLRVNAIKDELKRGLEDTFEKLRAQLRLSNSGPQAPSQITSYFARLEQTCLEDLRRIANEKSRDLQQELELLAGERALSQKNREAQAKQLTKQIDEWEAMQDRIDRLRTELIELLRQPTS